MEKQVVGDIEKYSDDAIPTSELRETEEEEVVEGAIPEPDFIKIRHNKPGSDVVEDEVVVEPVVAEPVAPVIPAEPAAPVDAPPEGINPDDITYGF